MHKQGSVTLAIFKMAKATLPLLCHQEGAISIRNR